MGDPGHCWAAQEIVTIPTRTGVTDSDAIPRAKSAEMP